MDLEPLSKQEFEDGIATIEKTFECTIVERFPLPSVGKMLREIAVSKDKQMFFLRLGNQAQPIPFNQIKKVEHGKEQITKGKEVVTDNNNHLGLTAAAALCGWFVYSQTSGYKVKDKIVDVHYVRINLQGNPNADAAWYLCNSVNDAIMVQVKLQSLLKKYRNGSNDKNDKAKDNGIVALIIVGLIIVIASPILGIMCSSWELFFLLGCLGVFVFLIGIFFNEKSFEIKE